MIAQLAIRTGIAPNDLLEAPPEILSAIVEILAEEAEETKRQQLREKFEGKVR